MRRRGRLIGKLSLLSCLNHLNSASVTSLRRDCRNSFILHPFWSYSLMILILFFQMFQIEELTSYSRNKPALYSPFSSFHITNFSCDALNLLLFLTVSTFPRCHFAVKCSSWTVEGNFTHEVNCLYSCHFRGLEFIQLPENVEGLPCQRRGDE